MFACLFLPPAPLSSSAGRSPSPAREALVGLAREFSPRVEARGDSLVVVDIRGLDRLLGDAWTIGRELRRAAADRGMAAHVAVAATQSAAMLLACGRSGLTVARPGEERRLLADLPLSVLSVLAGEAAAGPGRRPRASALEKPCDAGLSSRGEAVGVPAGPVPPSPTADRRPTPHGSMPCRLSPSIARSATFPPRSPQRDTRDPLRTENRELRTSLSTTHYPLPTVLRRWGLRTLGELAALPAAEFSERLGQDGVWWQRVARGEDAGPLVPDLPEKRYEASLDLEWPIEGLEPLSFVFARLFEPLCAELAQDDRAAAVLHVAFTLVTRETDARALQLPAPMRDPRVLRTLVLLNLESRPVAAGIDRITVTVDPAPGRIVQGSLLERALPTPEQLAPLVARLGALVGEERVGAAALVDSYRPEAFRMTPFSMAHHDGPFRAAGPGRRPRASALEKPCDAGLSSRGEAVGVPAGPVPPSPTADRRPTPHGSIPCRLSPSIARSATFPPRSPQRDTRDPLRTENRELRTSLSTTLSPLPTVLRRFRIPIPARVQMEDGAPVRVATDRAGLAGGRVERSAGPWRTSGEWWQLADARLQPRADGRPAQVGWNRDEWDVALGDGGLYRIYRDREANRWFIDGIVD